MSDLSKNMMLSGEFAAWYAEHAARELGRLCAELGAESIGDEEIHADGDGYVVVVCVGLPGGKSVELRVPVPTGHCWPAKSGLD